MGDFVGFLVGPLEGAIEGSEVKKVGEEVG